MHTAISAYINPATIVHCKLMMLTRNYWKTKETCSGGEKQILRCSYIWEEQNITSLEIKWQQIEEWQANEAIKTITPLSEIIFQLRNEPKLVHSPVKTDTHKTEFADAELKE